MDIQIDPTVQKLFRSFMLFRRAEWHQRSIAGYKPSEVKVLFCVKKARKADAPDMKVSEISKHLHVTAPTITQVIKSLEANGLIERHVDPSDRRSVGIVLTEKGEQVIQQAAEAFMTSLSGLKEYLGEEQSDQLAELLLKASYYFNEKAACENYAHWSGDEHV